MKEVIRRRLERAITVETKINELFDLLLTTTETTFETESSMQGSDARFVVKTAELSVYVTCNDQVYDSVRIDVYGIDDITKYTTVLTTIGGKFEENSESIPKSVRKIIKDFIETLNDVFDEFIDSDSTDGTDDAVESAE